MIKIVKMKKKWYGNLMSMYRDLELIESHYEKESCNPSFVYVNPKDEALIIRAYKVAYKKEYPYISKMALEKAVGMEMLNLGPNISRGVNPGYVIIDK